VLQEPGALGVVLGLELLDLELERAGAGEVLANVAGWGVGALAPDAGRRGE
jgi:hypothetical protein